MSLQIRAFQGIVPAAPTLRESHFVRTVSGAVMKCSRCQHDNTPAAKFCEECAAPLLRTCVGCGTQLSASAKFCPECGQPAAAAPATAVAPPPTVYTPKHLAEKILSSRDAIEGERKLVTVLFADLKGSMELIHERDPEDARSILDPVLKLMMDAVHFYEGTVSLGMGDGIMAIFGAPLAHEDHAVRACYAALRMQEQVRVHAEEALRTWGVPIEIRVGLNSGDVVVRSVRSDLHMDYTAIGETTHLAARMEQTAMPGTILAGPGTMRLTEGYVVMKPLGPRQVKGRATPIEVYEVVGATTVRSRLQATAARGLAGLVGRGAEMELLSQSLERARGGQGQVVAIVGEAGIGKSRLLWELRHSPRAENWLVLESSSVSYGKSSSYLPLIELVKAYFHIDPADDMQRVRDKVTEGVLALDPALQPYIPALFSLLDVPQRDPAWDALDPPQRRQRTLDGVRSLLLVESRTRPVMVLLEDLQWIDAETQAFLDCVVDSLPKARILLLANYRPEYQHTWARKSYYRELRLDALPPDGMDALLDSMLGPQPALAPMKRLLIERTEGNPFFLEESIRALVEMQFLDGEPGNYRLLKAAETLQIPPSAQAILTARIDRLSTEDKRVLQAAAVIGKDVPFSLLRELTEGDEQQLRATAAISRQPSSFTRPRCSRSSNSRSGTRSRKASRTAALLTSAGAPFTPLSCRRSSASIQTGSPNGSSVSRIMPMRARSGVRPSPTPVRRDRRRWRARQTARRSPFSSRRSPHSSGCRRDATATSSAWTFGSTCASASCLSASSLERSRCCTRPRTSRLGLGTSSAWPGCQATWRTCSGRWVSRTMPSHRACARWRSRRASTTMACATSPTATSVAHTTRWAITGAPSRSSSSPSDRFTTPPTRCSSARAAARASSHAPS
jgi:class 3 adenylate cyclase